MKYDSEPFITGQDISGNPDFYINLIIGLSAKYFGSENLEDLFSNWQYNLNRDKFDLFAVYLLEDFIYKKELSTRRVLTSLRETYAKKFLDDKYDLQRRNLALKENLFFDIQMKKIKKILGKDYKLNPKREIIYNNLRLSYDTNENNLQERVLKVFRENLNYRENELLKFSPLKNFTILDSLGFVKLERSNKPTIFGDFKNNKSSGLSGLLYSLAAKRRRERENFIEKNFGKSIYSEDQMKIIEEKYLFGAHKKSKLHFTRGLDNKDLSKEKLEESTIERHLLKFKKDKKFYDKEIKSLSKKIRVALSLQYGEEEVVTKRGRLVSRLAYKSMITERANIFSKKNLKPRSIMKVDLVLDASASLLEVESDIAIEAYIVSKSLENNDILNRVISYQSVGDYTVISILKDYGDKSDPQKIFRYKAMGWNRDGLFYRAYKNLIENINDNRLTIALTDAEPRDMRPLSSKNFFGSKKYSEEASLENTKLELDKLKKMGIHTSAILNSDKVDNAKFLFGSSYIKIKSVREIANVAGRFIQREIAYIEKK